MGTGLGVGMWVPFVDTENIRERTGAQNVGGADGWTAERAVAKDIVPLDKVRTRPTEGEGGSQLPEPGLEPAQRPGQGGKVRSGGGTGIWSPASEGDTLGVKWRGWGRMGGCWTWRGSQGCGRGGRGAG